MFKRLLLLGAMASFCLIPGAMTSTHAAGEDDVAPVEPAAAQPAEEVEVYARVNGEDVTRQDLDGMINSMMMRQFSQMQMNGGQPNMEDFQAIRDQITEDAKKQIIGMTAFKQAVAKKSESITEKEVDKRIDQITSLVEAEGGNLSQALASNNMTTETFRTDIKRQTASMHVVEDVTGEKMTPTDEQMKEFFEAHKEQMATPELLTTSHILFAFPEGPQSEPSEEIKAELKKKAEETLAKVKAGEDFGKLASELSDCPSAKDNGNLGANPRGQMVKEFDDAAWGMELGQISDVVETQFGYHIIKVTDRSEAAPADYAKLEGRIREQLIGQNMSANLDATIAKLTEEAKVEILAPEEPAEEPAPAPTEN